MTRTELETLVGAYYHEDFDMYDGTFWGAFDQYVRDSRPSELMTLIADIRHVLQSDPDDLELQRVLGAMGSNVYLGDEPRGYRGWLEDIAQRCSTLLS